MKKIFFNPAKIKLLLILVVFGMTLIITPVFGATNFYERALEGWQYATNEAYGSQETDATNMETFATSLKMIINILLSMLGIVFFLLMLYAGFLWMTAQGNEEQIAKAKKMIMDSAIALVILFTARLIAEVIFVLIGSALDQQG